MVQQPLVDPVPERAVREPTRGVHSVMVASYLRSDHSISGCRLVGTGFAMSGYAVIAAARNAADAPATARIAVAVNDARGTALWWTP